MSARFPYPVLCAALALCLSLGAAAAPSRLEPGSTAPAFELTDLDGTRHSLAGLTREGPALLVFWSSRCHFCHAMIPELKRIHRQFAPRGLTLAAINIGYEDAEEVARYTAENELDYLVLNDDERKDELAERYDLVGTPTLVLVARDGAVVYRGHTIPDLQSLLADLEARYGGPVAAPGEAVR